MVLVLKRLFLFVGLLLVVACSSKSIDDLKKQGELVVLTRNAPTTWYQGREGETGFEYDLIQSFAKHHDLKVRFVIKDNFKELLDSIQQGQAHIAAAGITKTAQRKQQGYLFGPVYDEVQQQVVCRRGANGIPKKVDDLVGKKISIIAGSTYIDSLKNLKIEQTKLQWDVINDVSTEQLLERVWKKEIDCTIADSNIIKISRRYYPELATGFSLSESQPLSWVITPEWQGILPEIQDWLTKIKADGEYDSIIERYYGHVQEYDYVDNRSFIRRIKSRLPKYKSTFEAAASRYNLPWTLLAAQSYQESHWNPRAKSPTGVRGMMMLTLNTAKSMGVKYRLNPTQSINGGAKYMQKMIRRIPEDVQSDDRIWYALAAYNIGFGHLKDAMLLANKQDLNANQWVNLKNVLPLLSNKKYYKELTYGYARGLEPVRYVQRIREYQQVLDKIFIYSQ
jgi:membrane-bound lytic murein transglycosylase F